MRLVPGVVPLSGNVHLGLGPNALDQMVYALVGDEPPDVQRPTVAQYGPRGEPAGVDAAVDDPDLLAKGREFAGVVVAHQQQARRSLEGAQPPIEVAVTPGVVGDEHRLAQQPAEEHALVGQKCVQLVAVHDVGLRHLLQQGRGDRTEPF
jgi:hypothetical protein